MTASVGSPIDPVLLEPVLAPLGQSRTLPAETYTSDAVLEWERRHFFEGTWVCVGRSADVASPGSQKAVQVGGERIVLIRDEERVLRGFYNVCRHRGHELLPTGAVANQRVVKCPYHAWRYRLDGTLLSAPRFDQLPADDPVREGLVRVGVEEWHGWIFVNASGNATVAATNVATSGPNAPGIFATSANGNASVTSTSVTTAGTNSRGIGVLAPRGNARLPEEISRRVVATVSCTLSGPTHSSPANTFREDAATIISASVLGSRPKP